MCLDTKPIIMTLIILKYACRYWSSRNAALDKSQSNEMVDFNTAKTSKQTDANSDEFFGNFTSSPSLYSIDSLRKAGLHNVQNEKGGEKVNAPDDDIASVQEVHQGKSVYLAQRSNRVKSSPVVAVSQSSTENRSIVKPIQRNLLIATSSAAASSISPMHVGKEATSVTIKEAESDEFGIVSAYGNLNEDKGLSSKRKKYIGKSNPSSRKGYSDFL